MNLNSFVTDPPSVILNIRKSDFFNLTETYGSKNFSNSSFKLIISNSTIHVGSKHVYNGFCSIMTSYHISELLLNISELFQFLSELNTSGNVVNL